MACKNKSCRRFGGVALSSVASQHEEPGSAGWSLHVPLVPAQILSWYSGFLSQFTQRLSLGGLRKYLSMLYTYTQFVPINIHVLKKSLKETYCAICSHRTGVFCHNVNCSSTSMYSACHTPVVIFYYECFSFRGRFSSTVDECCRVTCMYFSKGPGRWLM